MSSVLRSIVFFCLGAVVYSYILYPFVLMLIAGAMQLVRDVRYVFSKGDRRVVPDSTLPEVAIVIAAYNEQVHLQKRIDNLLALNYPAELMSIYIGSDGSRDGTAAILSAVTDHRVRTFIFEENRGKASVLNDLVSRARAQVLVFSDANTFFDADALQKLVRHFSDSRVGGVSGELRLMAAGGDNQDSLYWRVEQMLKFFEGRIHGLLGANGAIYAIRSVLWKPLRGDTICDDFCVAMNVAAAGHRLVYDPSAWAHEATPESIAEEYQRRVRIGIGNFQALVRHPEYILRTSAGTSLAYLSHKVLRWIAPHLLLLGLGASLVLAIESADWALYSVAQSACYLAASALYGLSLRGARLLGVFRIPAFLFALNWAFLVASWRFATGRYSGSWRRTVR